MPRGSLPDRVVAELVEEGDTVAAALTRLAVGMIEEMNAGDIWDLPRELYLICRQAKVVSEWNFISLYAKVTPLSVAEMDTPELAEFLSGVAWGLQEQHMLAACMLADYDVVGWMLIDEGWALLSTDEPHAEAVAKRHEVNTHPARKEIRFAVAADRAGTRYSVGQVRGQSDFRLLIDRGKNPKEQLKGLLPDALIKLCEALPGPFVPG